MSSNIKLWSPVPIENDSAAPVGAPESATLISDCDNIMREMMASVRQWYDNPSYIDLGLTLVSSLSTDSVIIQGDEQSRFSVGQPVQYDDAGGVNKSGHIAEIQLVSTDTSLRIQQGAVTENTVVPDVTAFRVGIKTNEYDSVPDVPLATVVTAFTSGGAGNTENLPATMTYDRNSEGRYTLTHNLGHRRYLPILTVEGAAARMITYAEPLNDSMEVHIRDKDGVYSSQAHTIILMVYPEA